MRLLVSGATASMHRFAAIPAWRPYLGHLIVPRARNKVAAIAATGLPVACDNGAFAGFDHGLFSRMVRDFLPLAEWIAIPDVVGSARGTAGLFHWYTERLHDIGGFDVAEMDEATFPMAFVAQDGMDEFDAAWHCGFVRCLFIVAGVVRPHGEGQFAQADGVRPLDRLRLGGRRLVLPLRQHLRPGGRAAADGAGR